MNVDTTAIEFLNTTATNNLALILLVFLGLLTVAIICCVRILNVPDAVPLPEEEETHSSPTDYQDQKDYQDGRDPR